MGLFDKLAQPVQGQRKQVTPDMMRQEVGNIRANPSGYLSRYGFNVPDGMNDPRQITQHLFQTGQVGGNRLQQVMRMIGAPIGR